MSKKPKYLRILLVLTLFSALFLPGLQDSSQEQVVLSQTQSVWSQLQGQELKAKFLEDKSALPNVMTKLKSFPEPVIFSESNVLQWLMSVVSSKEPGPESTIKTLRISAVGDCVLGCDDRYVSNNTALTFFDMAKKVNKSYFLSGVADILHKDDLTFANLENVLTSKAGQYEREPKPEQGNRAFWFYGTPDNVDILKQGGIDIVTIANNHSHDYQEAGYTDTVAALKDSDIPFTGYDEETLVTKNGIKIGSLGFNLLGKNERGVDLEEFMETAAAKIERLRPQCDLLVVQIHWGEEGANLPNLTQVNVGHFLIDMGADIVLGHHPHVLQPTEFYKDRYIAYSLGNFCFGGNQMTNLDNKLTCIWQLEAVLDSDGQLTLAPPQVIPCSVTSEATSFANDYRPVPLTDLALTQSATVGLAVLTTEELQSQVRQVFPENPYNYAPLTEENAWNMVDAVKYVPGLKKDMRYFTDRNFLGRPFYESDKVYLRKTTAEKLKGVVADLKEHNLTLLVWDAYRPPEAQWKMWAVEPDARYVANPNGGYSKHSYGSTMDVTLADAQGVPLEMPTDFDDFSPQASHDLSNIESAEARKNVQILRQVMEKNGFTAYHYEWWHYTDGEGDRYGPVLDLGTLLERPQP